MSSGGQQIQDILNGGVGLVVGGFQFAVGAVSGIRLVVEAAVGQWAAHRLWKNRNSRATWMPLPVSR